MVIPDDHLTNMVEVFQIRTVRVVVEVDDVLEEAADEINQNSKLKSQKWSPRLRAFFGATKARRHKGTRRVFFVCLCVFVPLWRMLEKKRTLQKFEGFNIKNKMINTCNARV